MIKIDLDFKINNWKLFVNDRDLGPHLFGYVPLLGLSSLFSLKLLAQACLASRIEAQTCNLSHWGFPYFPWFVRGCSGEA